MQKRTRRYKEQDRNRKLFLKELPYYNFTGNLTLYHGQFNNSLIQNQLPTKRQLENLNGLHDLDLDLDLSRETFKFLLMSGDNTFHSLLDIIFNSSMEDVSIDVADNAIDMHR